MEVKEGSTRVFQGLTANQIAIRPDQLQMLHGMLEQWCAAHKFEKTDWQASDAAARMISLFQGCGNNEARFRELMKDFN